jgi:tRNA threonylcarbamoyladenosine biosynthesis protein TsaB
LEAGRRRLAIGWYRAEQGKWRSEERLENLTLEEFAAKISQPTLIAGELSAEARYRLEQTSAVIASPVQSVRRPAMLAQLAWERWENGDTDDVASLKPIYLHHGDPIPG